VQIYAGNSASGAYFWGVQQEAGAFPSSYIPTTTVSVARTADSCIRTLSSEFSATAGTVVVAGRASGGQDAAAGQLHWSIDDNTANERYSITRPVASDVARLIVVDGGVAQATLDGTFVNLAAFKSAFAYAVNDFAHSFNGGAVLADASGTLPAPTQICIGSLGGSSQANGHIRRFDYYPTRMSNGFLVSAST